MLLIVFHYSSIRKQKKNLNAFSFLRVDDHSIRLDIRDRKQELQISKISFCLFTKKQLDFRTSYPIR